MKYHYMIDQDYDSNHIIKFRLEPSRDGSISLIVRKDHLSVDVLYIEEGKIRFNIDFKDKLKDYYKIELPETRE